MSPESLIETLATAKEFDVGKWKDEAEEVRESNQLIGALCKFKEGKLKSVNERVRKLGSATPTEALFTGFVSLHWIRLSRETCSIKFREFKSLREESQFQNLLTLACLPVYLSAEEKQTFALKCNDKVLSCCMLTSLTLDIHKSRTNPHQGYIKDTKELLSYVDKVLTNPDSDWSGPPKNLVTSLLRRYLNGHFATKYRRFTSKFHACIYHNFSPTEEFQSIWNRLEHLAAVKDLAADKDKKWLQFEMAHLGLNNNLIPKQLIEIAGFHDLPTKKERVFSFLVMVVPTIVEELAQKDKLFFDIVLCSCVRLDWALCPLTNSQNETLPNWKQLDDAIQKWMEEDKSSDNGFLSKNEATTFHNWVSMQFCRTDFTLSQAFQKAVGGPEVIRAHLAFQEAVGGPQVIRAHSSSFESDSRIDSEATDSEVAFVVEPAEDNEDVNEATQSDGDDEKEVDEDEDNIEAGGGDDDSFGDEDIKNIDGIFGNFDSEKGSYGAPSDFSILEYLEISIEEVYPHAAQLLEVWKKFQRRPHLPKDKTKCQCILLPVLGKLFAEKVEQEIRKDEEFARTYGICSIVLDERLLDKKSKPLYWIRDTDDEPQYLEEMIFKNFAARNEKKTIVELLEDRTNLKTKLRYAINGRNNEGKNPQGEYYRSFINMCGKDNVSRIMQSVYGGGGKGRGKATRSKRSSDTHQDEDNKDPEARQGDNAEDNNEDDDDDDGDEEDNVCVQNEWKDVLKQIVDGDESGFSILRFLGITNDEFTSCRKDVDIVMEKFWNGRRDANQLPDDAKKVQLILLPVLAQKFPSKVTDKMKDNDEFALLYGICSIVLDARLGDIPLNKQLLFHRRKGCTRTWERYLEEVLYERMCVSEKNNRKPDLRLWKGAVDKLKWFISKDPPGTYYNAFVQLCGRDFNVDRIMGTLQYEGVNEMPNSSLQKNRNDEEENTLEGKKSCKYCGRLFDARGLGKHQKACRTLKPSQKRSVKEMNVSSLENLAEAASLDAANKTRRTRTRASAGSNLPGGTGMSERRPSNQKDGTDLAPLVLQAREKGYDIGATGRTALAARRSSEAPRVGTGNAACTATVSRPVETFAPLNLPPVEQQQVPVPVKPVAPSTGPMLLRAVHMPVGTTSAGTTTAGTTTREIVGALLSKETNDDQNASGIPMLSTSFPTRAPPATLHIMEQQQVPAPAVNLVAPSQTTPSGIAQQVGAAEANVAAPLPVAPQQVRTPEANDAGLLAVSPQQVGAQEVKDVAPPLRTPHVEPTDSTRKREGADLEHDDIKRSRHKSLEMLIESHKSILESHQALANMLAKNW